MIDVKFCKRGEKGMDRLKNIKSIADFKELLILNKESIKKAALPITVVAALLFFWIGGGSDSDSPIVEEQNTDVQVESEEATYNDEYENNDESMDNMQIYVDIGGCVYMVEDGTRLFEIIEKAGGLTSDADINSINRAEAVYDGQKIMIMSKSNQEGGVSDYSTNGQQMMQSSNGKININYADSQTLQEIPGVGPATAQKIIEYRDSISKFKTIEDIKNVSGIGDKTFESLKEYITV